MHLIALTNANRYTLYFKDRENTMFLFNLVSLILTVVIAAAFHEDRGGYY